jgi:hypothetical protein
MISIARDGGLITVINVFSCDPAQQADLMNAWREAEPELGRTPGAISTALHRSLDGTRAVNYAQIRSAEDWERLREVGQTRGYFHRIARFGRPEALHAARERPVA